MPLSLSGTAIVALYQLLAPERENFLDLPLHSEADFKKWVNEAIAGESVGLSLTRMVAAKNGGPAGIITLTQIDRENGTAEMGTWLGQAFRGTGLNDKAKREMLSIAFSQLNLETVLLITAQSNLASIRALAKLPYVTTPPLTKYEKLRKYREFQCGREVVVYEVTRCGWYGMDGII